VITKDDLARFILQVSEGSYAPEDWARVAVSHYPDEKMEDARRKLVRYALGLSSTGRRKTSEPQGALGCDRRHADKMNFIATKRSWAFGVTALALTTLGWLWFVVCFTARVGAWWNSLYFFAAIYLVATVVALLGIRSVLSIFGLVSALLSLGFVLLFIFG